MTRKEKLIITKDGFIKQNKFGSVKSTGAVFEDVWEETQSAIIRPNKGEELELKITTKEIVKIIICRLQK